MNEAGPQEGDEVRARGSALLMTVESTNLGPGGMHHGIQDAVLCTWTDEAGEDCEEIYPPSSLIVVRRAAERT